MKLREHYLIESDNIPNEFYCSISQDIMSDPVKTIDNHTYDRISIERWFTHRVTSPLTGLPLSSTLLTPNNELKNGPKNHFTLVKI